MHSWLKCRSLAAARDDTVLGLHARRCQASRYIRIAARFVCDGSMRRSAVSFSVWSSWPDQADPVDDHRNLLGDERDVRRAGARRVDRDDRAGADVTARLVVHREQPAVSRRRRHRRIAVVERDLGDWSSADASRRSHASPLFALTSCSGDSVRRSPATVMCSATTFRLPDAEPSVPVLSVFTSVPPSARPGLNVRYASAWSCV